MLGRWWVGGCEARAGVGACKFRQQISSRPDANIVQHVPQQPAAATNRPFLSLPTSLSGILSPAPAPPLRHHNHREAGHVIDSLELRSTRFLCAVVRSSLSLEAAIPPPNLRDSEFRSLSPIHHHQIRLPIRFAMSATGLPGGASAPSPRSFALAHQRPKHSFVGCSLIREYDILGKLGEGTFG